MTDSRRSNWTLGIVSVALFMALPFGARAPVDVAVPTDVALAMEAA
jgi:hypothetical protein